MCDALLRFYHLHINHTLTIRRIQLNATQVRSDDDIPMTYKQLSLFDEEKIEVDLSKENQRGECQQPYTGSADVHEPLYLY